MPSDAYAAAGVRATADAPEFATLTDRIRATFAFPAIGRPLLDLGYYANVLPIGDTGVAVSMDGVGTKVVIAQQLGDYRGIGTDLIAMNVNDLLCVGADPIALLDYIAIDRLDSPALQGLVESLVRGAEEAGIAIPGGEVAQVRELLTPHGPDGAWDIAGTAIGVVPLDRIMIGQDLAPGDVLIGLAASGLHSNGYTLARRLLLRDGWDLTTHVPELGRTLGAELLEPTRLYVRFMREIWRREINPSAAFHMTGEGLLNLLRTPVPVVFALEAWPDLPPIFRLLQERGQLDAATCWTTFNMGVGFILALRAPDAEAALAVADACGIAAWRLGHVLAADTPQVRAPDLGLMSEGKRLVPFAI